MHHYDNVSNYSTGSVINEPNFELNLESEDDRSLKMCKNKESNEADSMIF